MFPLRCSSEEACINRYIRPNNNIFFTNNFKYIPTTTTTTELTNMESNNWCLLFFPYFLSLFTNKFNFIDIIKHWLFFTSEGKKILCDILSNLNKTHDLCYSQRKFGKITRNILPKQSLNDVVFSSAWIEQNIPIKKYENFKKNLNQKNSTQSKILPTYKELKKFSGGLRKYILYNTSFGCLIDENKNWICVGNGEIFLNKYLQIFKNKLEDNNYIYIKHTFDYRKNLNNTIYSISLIKENANSSSVVTVGMFKENNERIVISNDITKNLFKQIYTTKEILIDNNLYKIKHIISPDLAALRSSVNLQEIKNDVQEVIVMIEIYIAFYAGMKDDVDLIKYVILPNYLQ
ncbi:hypothetical protein ABK040_008565 [Willaertia magna]